MIEIKDKANCCGCESCALVCPTKIIKMTSDAEGFIYPQITDITKCINCNKCNNVCPQIKTTIQGRKIIKTYTGFSKNEFEIKQCASGGIATSLTKSFIENGGIAYGVQYSTDFKSVIYSRHDNINYIDRLRTSKYCSTRKFDIFNNVITDLKLDKKVLFIGLPCDIAAIYNFTKNKYSNLYTIELICHGVTSPKVQEETTNNLEKQYNSSIVDFSVRHKLNSWKPYYIFAKFKNGKEYIELFRPTNYGIAFHYLKRPSCNKCKFKLNNSQFGLQADITIGDNHGVRTDNQSYNKWGSSVAFIHTDKGVELINLIKDNFHIYESSSDLTKCNRAINEPIPARINRNNYSKIFIKRGLDAASKSLGVKFYDNYINVSTKLRSTLGKCKRYVLSKLR